MTWHTWLRTAHIDFSHLSAVYRVGNASNLKAEEKRDDLIDFHYAQPDLPFPVSPKSVYRLAHFLELPDFQSLAPNAYKAQLTKDIVAYELTSEVSAVYDELRFAALDVAVRDFAYVRASVAMQEVTKRMLDDEALRDRFAKVMAELLARG